MNLEDTTTIQLLISPTLTKDQLEEEITAAENQAVISSAVSITPRMKAELKSADPEAFNIQPLHDSAEQLISTGEPTEWEWLVGLAITSIAVPLFVRWLDQRKKRQKD